MITAINQTYTEVVQSTNTSIFSKNLSEGQVLPNRTQEPPSATLELSAEAISRSKQFTDSNEIKLEKPREKSLSIETLDSRIRHVENSLKEADSLNLSFDERAAFLKEEGLKWVQEIKQNNPKMYAEWQKDIR